MNILVTGGRGFLGRHVVDALVARGHTVVAPSRQDLDLSNLAAVEAWRPPVEIDGIVHVAALVGGLGFVNTQRLEVMRTNLAINLGAITLAEALEVSWFVGVGSACAYPESAEPLHESMLWGGSLHDSVFAYGATKRLLEALQHAWALGDIYRHSVHAILANLYGPGDLMEEARAHAATALIRRFVRAKAQGILGVKVWGDGTAEREFLFVADAANGLATLVDHAGRENTQGGHSRVNLGTGVSTTMRRFVETLVEATGYRGTVIWDAQAPAGVGRKVLDVTAARVDHGISATTALEEGIAAAVAWEQTRQ